MTEIITKLESCLVHYKNGERVAATFSNGTNDLMKVEEMNKKAIEDFFEVDQVK